MVKHNTEQTAHSTPESRIARSYPFRGQFRASELLGSKSYWQRLPERNIQTPDEKLRASIGHIAPVDAMPDDLPLERKRTTHYKGGNKGKLRSDHPLLRFVSANLPNEFARVSATVIRKLNQPRYSGTNKPRFADVEARDDGGEIQWNGKPATPKVRNGLTPDEQCDIHQTVAFTLLTLGRNGDLANEDWALCFSAARAEIGVERYADYASNRFASLDSVPETELAYTPAARAMAIDAQKRQRIARAFRKANQLACLAFRHDNSRKRKARFLRVIYALRAHLTLRDCALFEGTQRLTLRDCALFEGQSESTQRKLYFDLRAYLAEGERATMREAIAETRAILAQRKRQAYKVNKLTYAPFASVTA